VLDVSASSYWDQHYTLNDASSYKRKNAGDQLVSTTILNAVIPVMYTYGECHGEERYIQKALEWFGMLKAERNRITEGFEAIGAKNSNAGDSQALLELKKQYCERRRCLDCAIGVALLRSNTLCANEQPASSDIER
jgi:hypothetical protein